MSTEITARLGLPLLAPGQAQKELFHNEALAAVDMAVQPSVRGIGLASPPSDTKEGDCWIVGPAPAGEWAARAGAIACCTAAGWRFVVPREGFAVWDQSNNALVRHVAGRWAVGALATDGVFIGGHQVVGARQPGIAPAQGGATVDAEARGALAAVLSALQVHGLIGT